MRQIRKINNKLVLLQSLLINAASVSKYKLNEMTVNKKCEIYCCQFILKFVLLGSKNNGIYILYHIYKVTVLNFLQNCPSLLSKFYKLCLTCITYGFPIYYQNSISKINSIEKFKNILLEDFSHGLPVHLILNA